MGRIFETSDETSYIRHIIRFNRPLESHIPKVSKLRVWGQLCNTLCSRKERTGLPSVHNSQSNMPITRFSVGW